MEVREVIKEPTGWTVVFCDHIIAVHTDQAKDEEEAIKLAVEIYEDLHKTAPQVNEEEQQ